MRVNAHRSRFVATLIATAILGGFVLEAAAASTGTCIRRRQTPSTNIFWICVTEHAACDGDDCQTVSYTGFIPFKSCECLPTSPDPNDFSYGTGGIWNTSVTSGSPTPGSTLTFQLENGGNELVVYPHAALNGTQVQGAQVFTGSNALSGTLTVQLGAADDSVEAHMVALTMTMTSFNYEGQPTGLNTITLALDGSTATGHWLPLTHTLQFDEPVHCLVTNTLHGAADFYFRPILTEAQETASGRPTTQTNPFELFTTGSFVPSKTVPVVGRQWSDVKALFR